MRSSLASHLQPVPQLDIGVASNASRLSTVASTMAPLGPIGQSAMNEFEIQIDACCTRQQRVVDLMQRNKLDLVVVTQIEHVQYLAGTRFGWVFQPAAALTADGKLTLVA